jgi:hypothetical protein
MADIVNPSHMNRVPFVVAAALAVGRTLEPFSVMADRGRPQTPQHAISPASA